MQWNFIVVFCGLIAAILPFAGLIINFNSMLLFRDHALLFLPGKFLWAQYVTNDKQLPYWNYHFGGGLPFYADISLSPLHPLNFIFLLFPLDKISIAYNIFIIAHYFLIYLAAYYLLRKISLHKDQALLWGFCFTWSGAAISSNSSIMLLGAYIGVLLSLTQFLNFFRSQKKIYLFLASAACSLPIYCGDPQFTYLLILIATFIFFIRKNYFESILIFFLSFLFSAPQILPSIAFIRESARGFANLTLSNAETWSFHPIRWLEYFYPFLLGTFSSQFEYWPIPYINSPSGEGLPFIPSFYIGSLAFISILFSFILFSQSKQFRKNKIYLFFFLNFCFFQILAFGKYSPVPIYSLLHKILPFWDSFRYPERINLFANIFLLIAAAFAWRRIPLTLLLSGRKNIYYFALISINTILTIFIFSLYSSMTNEKNPFLLQFITCLMSIFILYLWQKKIIAKKSLILLLFLVSNGTMLLHANNWIFTSPQNIANPASYSWWADLEKLRSTHRSAEFFGAAHRIASSQLYKDSPDYSLASTSLNYSTQLALAYFDNLAPNTATLFDLPMASVYHTLLPEKKRVLFDYFAGDEKKLADLDSVYYLAKRTSKNEPRKIISNPSAMPYFFFPKNILLISEYTIALEKLKDQNFNPTTDVILSSKQSDTMPPLYQMQHSNTIQAKQFRKNGRKIIWELDIIKTSTTATLFVWNENYNSNWKAKINDIRLPIEIINISSMGVWLPPLEKNKKIFLEIYYDDPLIFIGQILFLLWILLLILHTLYSYKLFTNTWLRTISSYAKTYLR